MSLQLGKCIFHRWLMPPEDGVGTRIRFKTSMPGRYFDQESMKIRTFEATLRDVSSQRETDIGDPQYGFVLDETLDSASIIPMLREQYEENSDKVLAEWADDPTMLPKVKNVVSNPPVFRLETSAKYIFAEGDRVTVTVPNASISSIYEILGDIVELEIID